MSQTEARRVALAAQGFVTRQRSEPPGADDIVTLIRRLGLLQLDTVNVFCRSHYMPVYSRIGPYDRGALDRIAAHTTDIVDRQLVEYPAHEASLIPLDSLPLFRWRMAQVDREAWAPLVKLVKDNPIALSSALTLVSEQGPIRASSADLSRATEQTTKGLWNFKEGKAALEYLYFGGLVSVSGRVNFERLYDLPERVLPSSVLKQPTLSEPEAQRELIRIAANALGVASEPDLGDYFRLSRSVSKSRVAELVENGELMPVSVDGWRLPAYLWPSARRPRTLAVRCLLSPFDSLIWFRDRTEQLFNFQYRIEIYTPAAKRAYGYYVLPFLLGNSLVARVDLKSDRKAKVLRVQSAFGERGIDPKHVSRELAEELRQVATWLELDEVTAEDNGNLAKELRKALR
jgi:uncharacterized protein YcaQ